MKLQAFPKKTGFLIDSALIVLLTTILIWPLFRVEYLDNWTSIDSTFIADARMLADHLPHPGWQPLWYAGGRFDYIYPPALRYGTALIAHFGGVSTFRAYHLFTAFFYVFGMLAVYWLVIVGTGSRIAGWIAAAASALTSPIFLFLEKLRFDSGFLEPQRLHVLLLYGEGPHMSALAVLPAALAVIWLALRDGSRKMLALSAILCALVVSTNFYGATALALLVPVLVWSIWLGHRDWRVPVRIAAIAILAYGLCAFWLTPAYIRVTIDNLKLVAEPGDMKSAIAFFALIVHVAVISYFVGNRRPQRSWSIFCAVASAILAIYILGHEFYGIQVTGVPLRLATEFDLALILAFATFVAWIWTKPRGNIVALALLVGAFWFSPRYIRHAWDRMGETKSVDQVYSYQIAQWLRNNIPDARVFATGEARFWLNAWTNVAQADGGSLQGMENNRLPVGFWQIWAGEKQEVAVRWLQAMAVDAIIVPGKNSRDNYRTDMRFPQKFRGLQVLHDDGHDTVIYRVPRSYPRIGRVVQAGVLDSIGQITQPEDMDRLNRYAGEIEKPGRPPVSVSWDGFEKVNLRAETASGESVLLQETFDPAWVAEEHGKRLEIRRDPVMSFMVIPVSAGHHEISLRFTTPRGNRIGQIVTLLSLVLVGGLVFVNRR